MLIRHGKSSEKGNGLSRNPGRRPSALTSMTLWAVLRAVALVIVVVWCARGSYEVG